MLRGLLELLQEVQWTNGHEGKRVLKELGDTELEENRKEGIIL